MGFKELQKDGLGKLERRRGGCGLKVMHSDLM